MVWANTWKLRENLKKYSFTKKLNDNSYRINAYFIIYSESGESELDIWVISMITELIIEIKLNHNNEIDSIASAMVNSSNQHYNVVDHRPPCMLYITFLEVKIIIDIYLYNSIALYR